MQVHVLVKPTERADRVALAVDRIFPNLILDIRDDRVQGYGGLDNLLRLHGLLREQRILDTARSVMLAGTLGEMVQFRLSKMGALMGRIGFPPEEEPLGSIHVQISGDRRLVDWLAPRTEDGRPVFEIELATSSGDAARDEAIESEPGETSDDGAFDDRSERIAEKNIDIQEAD